MILSNNVPNQIWDAAMGNQTGVRFPPGSWSRGGGGYMGYGVSQQVAKEDVQTDVLKAFGLAISELKAQAYVRLDIPKPMRDAALASIAHAEEGLKNLMVRQSELSVWLDTAEMVAVDLRAAAVSLGDSETGPWLDSVISGGRGAPGLGGIPMWAIGLGLAVAAFVGYKLLKK